MKTINNTQNNSSEFHSLRFNQIGPATLMTFGDIARETERLNAQREATRARVAAMSPADQIRHRLANCAGSSPSLKKQRRKLRAELAQLA